MKNKVTIKDIADKAGVSTATVSRVISGKDKVKEETKQLVNEIIKNMGYDANKKHSLSYQSSKAILICVTELVNPFIVPVLEGIQNSSRKNGYYTMILQTKDSYTEFSEYEQVLKEQHIAGVIFLSSMTGQQLKSITEQLNGRVPIVFCSEYVENSDISLVGINDIEAIQKSTSYLLAQGKRKILFVNSTRNHNYARNREKGYRDLMKTHNISINEDYVIHLPSVNYALAYSAVSNILKQQEQPDAILCTSDVYAVAALKACQKAGIRVPEDCAIIGFDNIELTNMLHPSITTIEQPTYQLGYQAGEILHGKIMNPDAKVKRIILDTELIVRDSTK